MGVLVGVSGGFLWWERQMSVLVGVQYQSDFYTYVLYLVFLVHTCMYNVLAYKQ